MPSHAPVSSRGLAYAVVAYLIWGLVLPVYMKLLSDVSPVEITAQRILWSIPCALALLLWTGRLRAIAPVLRQPRTMGLAAVTACLISVNWGIYCYAILIGHTVDAALGYYINPLVNILLGALFLGERPTRLQSLAIALAVLAVAILTFQSGGLPWISLVLATSFGVYGLLRKIMPVGAAEGFFLEVLILAAPSLAIVGWTVATGESRFLASPGDAGLLMGAGLATSVPLILYAAGAKLLPYSTIGVLQYIAPTLVFLTAVFVFGEPFSRWQLVAFVIIWTAVAVYIVSLTATGRPRKAEAPGARVAAGVGIGAREAKIPPTSAG